MRNAGSLALLHPKTNAVLAAVFQTAHLAKSEERGMVVQRSERTRKPGLR
jgi:hypothetical protein